MSEKEAMAAYWAARRAKARRRRRPYLITGGVGLAALLVAAIVTPQHACGCIEGHVARQLTCESNLKQIGLAVAQYAEDNNGMLPATVSAAGQDWRGAIYPFVKSTGVYRCPEDKRDGSRDSAENLPKSYGGNAAVLTGRAGTASPTSILAVDMRGWGGADWDMTSPAFLPSTGRRLYAHFPRHQFYERPGGTVNCLFGDGHVKALAPSVMLTPINYWMPDNKPFTGPSLKNARAILARTARE